MVSDILNFFVSLGWFKIFLGIVFIGLHVLIYKLYSARMQKQDNEVSRMRRQLEQYRKKMASMQEQNKKDGPLTIEAIRQEVRYRNAPPQTPDNEPDMFETVLEYLQHKNKSEVDKFLLRLSATISALRKAKR